MKILSMKRQVVVRNVKRFPREEALLLKHSTAAFNPSF
jgi:hypothetical protein